MASHTQALIFIYSKSAVIHIALGFSLSHLVLLSEMNFELNLNSNIKTFDLAQLQPHGL